MGERGNLQEIRDEMQQILDRIDTKLIERQEEQTPQQRERVFGRLVRGSVVAAALVAAWRWIVSRPGQIAAVAATGALGAILIVVSPPDGPGAPTIPEPYRPLPWNVMPPVGSVTEPDVSVSATVTPEPTTESESGLAARAEEPEVDEVTVESAVTELVLGEAPEVPEPEPLPTAEPSPGESPEAEPKPSPEPEPAPTPQPTEPPYTEQDVRDLCLDLDLRPVVGLGACIRQLLGLL